MMSEMPTAGLDSTATGALRRTMELASKNLQPEQTAYALLEYLNWTLVSQTNKVWEIAGSRCESPAHTRNASAQPRPSQDNSTSTVDGTAAPPTSTGNASATPRPTQRDSTSVVAYVTAAPPLSTALLAHQLPPLQKYSGETTASDGETFRDWKEKFELVASVCNWDPQAKLVVNLVTRLNGQAYAFYRSCTPSQCSSYEVLVGELTKRFAPVRIQAI